MTNHILTVPTDQGLVNLNSGQICPNGKQGELQVFLYTTSGNTYFQKKLTDPTHYVISPQTNIPPGDCLIIELDQPKNKTDKLCQSYQIAKQLKKIHEQQK